MTADQLPAGAPPGLPVASAPPSEWPVADSNVSARPDAAPRITVVVCTHNRAGHLRSALASLAAQGETAWPFEVILVDNRSTDGTATLGRALEERGVLRLLHEPRLGLCFARNAGWQAARGEVVAYFDDDALAEPGWLDAIAEAFSTVPRPGIVGGRVDPIWEAPRPPWLSDGIALSLTIIDWSPTTKLILDHRVEWLVGANMALPREVLAEVGGFDTRLDRIGSNMLSGGDVFLQKEVMARGYPCLYHPGMAIRHLASRARLTPGWFERRYYWQGVSDAVMTLIAERPSAAARARLGLRAARDLLASRTALARLARRSDDPAEFEARCMALIRVGYAAGLLWAARA